MSDALIQRLENVVLRIAPNAEATRDGPAPCVAAYDAFYTASVTPFLEAVNKYPELKTVSEWTIAAFQHQRNVVEASTVCAKPSDEEYMKFLGPIVDVINKSGNPNPRDNHFNYLKAFNEFIQSFSWLMMPGPKEFINTQGESASMYLNRILSKVKDLEDEPKANGRAFVKTIKELIKNMAEYAGDFHKSGLMWKFKGLPIGEFESGAKAATGNTDDKKVTTDDRLEIVILALEAFAAKQNAGGDEDSAPACIVAYQAFLKEHVTSFAAACNAFPETKSIAAWVEKAFTHTGFVVEASLTCANPGDSFMKVLQPCIDVITASQNTPPTSDPFFPHHKAFSEAVQGLNWLCAPSPPPIVQSQLDAAQMYTNKILMKAKDMEDTPKAQHRAFVKELKSLMNGLLAFVKEHFKSGLVWKFKGEEATAFESKYFAK